MPGALTPEVLDVLVERHRHFLQFLEPRRRDAERRAMERHAGETVTGTERDPDLDAALCECVHALIPTLKGSNVEILRAIEMEGHDLAAVTGRLGITRGNAAVRLHRARLALKAQLEASCGTCTEHGCLDCTCKAPRGL